jgi:tRNA-binding protein
MVEPEISFDDFLKVDMRAGEIVAVEDFPRARNPSYKITVDFGPEIGLRTTSAQAKTGYEQDELLGRFVVAVVNFPPKNIAGFQSEMLILGVDAGDGTLSLLHPGRGTTKGARVY